MADRNFTKNLLIADPVPGKFNWYYSWYRNSSTMDAVAYQTLRGNTVTSGMVVSNAGGLYVNVAAGVVSIGGTSFDIAAVTNLAVVAASIEDEQYNFVYVDNTGTVISSTIAPLGEFAILSVVDCDVSNVLRLSDLRNVSGGVEVLPTVENELINGDFQVWQRGTSLSLSDETDQFVADRWGVYKHGGNTDVSETTVSIAGITRKGVLFDHSVVSGTPGETILRQIVNGNAFLGEYVTATLYYEHVSGDYPTIELTDSMGGTSVPITGTGYYTVTLRCTITYQEKGLRLNITGDSNQLHTYKIAEASLYVSDTQLPVRRRSYEEELALCLPYYRVYGNDISIQTYPDVSTADTLRRRRQIVMNPPMVGAPVAVGGAASGGTLDSITTSPSSITVVMTATTGANTTAVADVTLDAEI